MEAYKLSIKESIKKEEESLKKAKNDKQVVNYEFLRKRIQKRIDMINAELTEEVEEHAEQGTDQNNKDKGIINYEIVYFKFKKLKQ